MAQYAKRQESGLRHRAAQRYAEISVSDSRFSLCPAGCVLRYSKQGLCVPQKSQSQPKSADSLGAQPPIPRRKERDASIGFSKERVNGQLRQNAENRYRLFTLESQAAHFYDNEILGYQAQSYRGKSSKKEWWYVAASKNCPDTGRRGPSTISLKNLC